MLMAINKFYPIFSSSHPSFQLCVDEQPPLISSDESKTLSYFDVP